MIPVRIESTTGPLSSSAELALAAATLVARSAVMGFLPPGTDTRVLDDELVAKVLAGLADQGVSVRQRLQPSGWTAESLREALDRALEQSEHSPMPAGEWPTLSETLGEELLSRLLGISVTSLRRYSRGARVTPQAVADRLHVLALIVADLAGAYNDYGIRRWFARPRPQLDGRAPVELLEPGWDSEGPEATRLRSLAAVLVDAGAT